MTLTPKLYFIGISGSGMLPLAQIARARGYEVFGADLSQSPRLNLLIESGAKVFQTHCATQVPNNASVVYSSAISEDNPELRFARDNGLTILHRSDLLANFMDGHKVITIAGSHGKTSTTAMIAHLLSKANLNPTIYCGGDIKDLDAVAGKGDYFIAEADESDGTFLKYQPDVSIVTDLGADHLDFYGTLESISNTFRSYLRQTKAQGCNILHWDNRIMHELVQPDSDCDLITYGKRLGSDIRLLSAEFNDQGTHYKIIAFKTIIEGQLKTIGEHNLQNLMAAFAVAHHLGLDLNAAAQHMSTFAGVSRRLSMIFSNKDFKVFDDYAHNPAKIQNCLNALRSAWSDSRIVAIFQPHRYSRLQTLYSDFSKSFASADTVLLTDVFSAGEQPHPNYSPEAFAEEIKGASGVDCLYCPTTSKLLGQVRENLTKGDIIVTIGAGDIHRIGYDIVQELKAQNRASEKT